MMKNMKLILIALLIIVSLFGCESNKVVYEYPITPESDEWKHYSTEELRDMLQLNGKEKELNTKDLLSVVLDYPYIGSVMAYDTEDSAIKTLRSQFDGLDELLKREDITKEVVDRYESMSKESEESNQSGRMFLETLLRSDAMQEKVTADDKERIQASKERILLTDWLFKDY